MQGSKSTDVFRVETTGPDGTVKAVEVIRTHDGYLMRGDSEASRKAESAGADPVALVQAALMVDAVTSIRITPAVWGPAISELLAALRIDPSALDGEEGDDRFEIASDGLDERIVAVPCWVGDCHVAGLVHGGRVVPVLMDDDEEGLAGEEFARYTWFSESGGAPVSWDGGAELLRLNGPLGLQHSWGAPGSTRPRPTSPERGPNSHCSTTKSRPRPVGRSSPQCSATCLCWSAACQRHLPRPRPGSTVTSEYASTTTMTAENWPQK
jgi:hypothetical protein